jgi:PAS domain S-box-containing protein
MKISRNQPLIKQLRPLDNTPSAHHLLSTKGTILWVNAAEAALLGYGKKEMVKRSFLDFIVPEQRADAWQRFKQKLAGVKVESRIDRTYVREDGCKIFVLSQDRIMTSPAGRKHVLTALTDITRIKQLQEEIGKLLRERQVQHLTANFSDANISNYTAALLLISQVKKTLDKDGYTNPLVRQQLGMINAFCREGVEQNRGIPGALRQITPAPAFAAISLADNVHNAVDNIKKEHGFREMTLKFTPAEGVVLGDAQLLRVAVGILLLNARDAIAVPEKGRIVLTLEPVTLSGSVPAVERREIGEGKYLRLTVSDNGCGISSEAQQTIFEPYISSKSPAENHGLGLTRLLEIIDLHRGGVTLESAVGVGTVVKLFIPALV